MDFGRRMQIFRSGLRRNRLSTVPTIRRNQFPRPVIPMVFFGRLFRRKIIFPTEKVTFSVGNSIRKIRFFRNGCSGVI